MDDNDFFCSFSCSVRGPYNFFSQLQRFFQQFNIWATIFATIFFGKIVVKIFVVFEGLYSAIYVLLVIGGFRFRSEAQVWRLMGSSLSTHTFLTSAS